MSADIAARRYTLIARAWLAVMVLMVPGALLSWFSGHGDPQVFWLWVVVAGTNAHLADLHADIVRAQRKAPRP